MFNSVTKAIIKKTAKTVATTTLDTLSFVFDKGAEYADDVKEFIEDLDKKDISAREQRKEKREN